MLMIFVCLAGRGYQEWEIENNTFHAMVMREGDACGEIFRSVKVSVTCHTGAGRNSVMYVHVIVRPQLQ